MDNEIKRVNSECDRKSCDSKSLKRVLIPFRLNKGAFNALAISFPYSVGGASCPALDRT